MSELKDHIRDYLTEAEAIALSEMLEEKWGGVANDDKDGLRVSSFAKAESKLRDIAYAMTEEEATMTGWRLDLEVRMDGTKRRAAQVRSAIGALVGG